MSIAGAVPEPCAAIASLFAQPVSAFRLQGDGWDFPLHDDEVAIVASAGPKRRSDFMGGRACAHASLRELAMDRGPISKGERGVPIWPSGTVGSISHADGLCAAVAARSATYKSLGLDIERNGRVTTRLEKAIMTVGDLRQLNRGSLDRSTAATLIFSAKEAFYKAQYPISQTFLEFEAVNIELKPNAVEAILQIAVPGLGPAGTRIRGRFALDGMYIITGFAL